MAKAPPHGGARSSPGSVAVRPRPDQLQAFLAFDLDQGRVDRGGEARIVELDREVVAVRLVGVLLPSGAELGIRCGEDAEVRALVGGVFDADQPSVAVRGEGADVSHCLVPLFQGRAHRDPMAVVRPEAIDPHPKGCNAVEGGRRRLFCLAMQSRRRRKKVVAGRCGDKIERTLACSSFGQTRPIGLVLGVAFANTSGMMTGSHIDTVIAFDGNITVHLPLQAGVDRADRNRLRQGIRDHPPSREYRGTAAARRARSGSHDFSAVPLDNPDSTPTTPDMLAGWRRLAPACRSDPPPLHLIDDGSAERRGLHPRDASASFRMRRHSVAAPTQKGA